MIIQRLAAAEGEAGTNRGTAVCSGSGVSTGGAVSLSDWYTASFAGSKRRVLFDGVKGTARPSHQPDRFDGVAVGVSGAAAGVGLGR